MVTVQQPTDQELKQKTEELIQAEYTMTIATACDGAAWAAPVYYANRDFTFYFFSDPKSRHIQESLKTNQAAAAIFCKASTWRDIRGIQMTGQITPVSAGLEALRAIRTYLHKFPFTREFFDSGQDLDLDAFAAKFRVRLYRFRPTLCYYLDNRIRFGFREEVPL